jgi:hypothetical protein
MRITVILKDYGNGPHNPLIYVVDVSDPSNYEEVAKAVAAARSRDIGGCDIDDIEPLFAFAGDVPTLCDWRD